MTCILGIKEKETGNIYIGGDSAGIKEYELQIRKDKKVFKKGPFLVGYSTSFRMGQLLKYQWEIPAQGEAQSDEDYLHNDFIESIRELFGLSGYTELKDGVERGGQFIFAFHNELYMVDGDYQIAQTLDDIMGIGCGSREGMGALYALKLVGDLSIPLALQIALEITSKLNNGVYPPFTIDCQQFLK